MKFKSLILKSSSCSYSDAYTLVKETITITGAERAGYAGDASQASREADERDKEVVFKNFATFTDCVSKINNAKIDNVEDLDVVMPVHSLIEYSDSYSKTSGSLWQYFKYEPPLDNTGSITNFPVIVFRLNRFSFKSNVKINGKPLLLLVIQKMLK